MRPIRFIITLFLCFACRTAVAQEPAAGFGIEANALAGRILKHTGNFRAPVPDLSTGFDLNFIQQTYGKKPWHQRRHFPLLGIGLYYTNYGIDSIYGRCISIYPNIELPLIKGKRLQWTVKAAYGLGYVTKRYSRGPVIDTLNNAIGSHFNNFSLFATDLRYRINRYWDVQVGLNFSHISNASLRQPNLGVNLYGGHIGVRYFPVTSEPERIVRNLQPLKNRWLAQVRVGIAFTEIGAPNGPLYPVYLASVFASKRYAGKNKAFVGVDYSYHEHIYAFLRNNEIHAGNERANSWKSSVFVGNEFLFGRVGIMLQVGLAIKKAYLGRDAYYQKLGGNFYIVQREHGPIKELGVGVLLKTHNFQAELAEAGITLGF